MANGLFEAMYGLAPPEEEESLFNQLFFPQKRRQSTFDAAFREKEQLRALAAQNASPLPATMQGTSGGLGGPPAYPSLGDLAQLGLLAQGQEQPTPNQLRDQVIGNRGLPLPERMEALSSPIAQRMLGQSEQRLGRLDRRDEADSERSSNLVKRANAIMTPEGRQAAMRALRLDSGALLGPKRSTDTTAHKRVMAQRQKALDENAAANRRALLRQRASRESRKAGRRIQAPRLSSDPPVASAYGNASGVPASSLDVNQPEVKKAAVMLGLEKRAARRKVEGNARRIGAANRVAGRKGKAWDAFMKRQTPQQRNAIVRSQILSRRLAGQQRFKAGQNQLDRETELEKARILTGAKKQPIRKPGAPPIMTPEQVKGDDARKLSASASGHAKGTWQHSDGFFNELQKQFPSLEKGGLKKAVEAAARSGYTSDDFRILNKKYNFPKGGWWWKLSEFYGFKPTMTAAELKKHNKRVKGNIPATSGAGATSGFGPTF